MIKKLIQEWKFRRTLRNSRKRYRVETSGVYEDHTFYVDSQDKDDVYYIFHNFLANKDAKIIVEFCDGSEREVKLGRRRKTRE